MPQSQKTLRTSARQRRRALDPAVRQRAQSTINHHLLKLAPIQRAQRIGVYLAMGSELDLHAFMQTALQQGKQLFVPRVQSDRMDFVCWDNDKSTAINRFGIHEPASTSVQKPQFLDVVITPLVAFDAHAHRIGQGGGYYDRTFAWLKHRQHWRKPVLLGAAFECQRVETIPANAWDIPLQAIITEKATYP